MLHLSCVLEDGGVAIKTGLVEHVRDLVGREGICKHKDEELGARSLVAEHFIVENKVASQEKHKSLKVHKRGRGGSCN